MNVKCTFKTDSPVYKGNLSRGNKYNFSINNFILNNEQISSISVTIYGHSPLSLNVSGIQSLDEVNLVQELIEKLYDVKCLDVRVDNIFLSHKDYLNLDVSKIYYYLRDYIDCHVDYNIELYPGMYIKSKNYPTINLFRTGSFQILGAKSHEQIFEIKNFVNMLVSMFNKST